MNEDDIKNWSQPQKWKSSFLWLYPARAYTTLFVLVLCVYQIFILNSSSVSSYTSELFTLSFQWLWWSCQKIIAISSNQNIDDGQPSQLWEIRKTTWLEVIGAINPTVWLEGWWLAGYVRFEITAGVMQKLSPNQL